jgi:MGT family glycosyltransferase
VITSTPRSFLFATWEGGGHVPPLLTLASRLQDRGHQVRLISDEANRPDAAAMGLPFTAWTRAPNRLDKRAESDPVREWAADNPADVVARLLDGVIAGPALAYAQDVLTALADEPADVVVANELLFGVMAAAEKAKARLALFTTNVWSFPDPLDQPCFGPGFPPAETDEDRARDAMVRQVTRMLFERGLPQLNAARAALDLPLLERLLDQPMAADRVLLGVSRAWDFPTAQPAPDRFRYVGPVVSDPGWSAGWNSPWPADDPRPLVVVSFSTFFQGQAEVLHRVIAALAPLAIRAVVTLGPALEARDFPAPDHILVVKSASHDALIPQASLLITHAGHGTAVRAIRHGVPILALPMGRDQADNAARVVHRGAGVRLDPAASTEAVRASAEAILAEPAYREAARRFGAALASAGDDDPVALLEALTG